MSGKFVTNNVFACQLRLYATVGFFLENEQAIDRKLTIVVKAEFWKCSKKYLRFYVLLVNTSYLLKRVGF